MVKRRTTNKDKPIRFTLYLPPDVNKKVEFLRWKEGLNKNAIVLDALAEYLPKKMKKHPEFKEAEQ